MSSDVLTPPSAAYMDAVKDLFLQPRQLFQGITGERGQWRQSALIALVAILCNSLIALMVKGGFGDSVLLALYLILVVVVYTGLVHFLGRWLLQAEGVSLPATSTAVNYVAALAAVVSIPYLGVVALLYFELRYRVDHLFPAVLGLVLAAASSFSR